MNKSREYREKTAAQKELLEAKLKETGARVKEAWADTKLKVKENIEDLTNTGTHAHAPDRRRFK